MKKILILFSMLFAVPVHATTTVVNCQISYTSADGSTTMNTVQNFELSPFTFAKWPIGNLILEVGIGGTAKTATGDEFSIVSVAITDSKYEIPQAGELSFGPNHPAKATYEAESSKESLIASCAVAR